MQPGRHPQLALRAFSTALLFAVASADYLEGHVTLSKEALQYQTDYPDAIRSGMSLWYGLGHLLILLGAVAGVAGAVLSYIRPRLALAPLLICLPAVACAAYLAAPQSNYPNVEPVAPFLMWCAVSAIWAFAVSFAWACRRGLWETRRG